MEYVIHLTWDEEASVWVAASDDISVSERHEKMVL